MNAQDYTQNQCKDEIRHDFTFQEANFVIHAMGIRIRMDIRSTWPSKQAVCEYHGAPATQLDTPPGYVMNTDHMLLSFPTFLELP